MKIAKFLVFPAIILFALSGCGGNSSVKSSPSPTPSQRSSFTIPTDCAKSPVLEALNVIVPDSIYIPTKWQPAVGTELADVLNNGGLACSYGIESAEIGITVKWVSDSGNLFEKRIPEWKAQGFKKVSIPGVDATDAYFQLKKQSPTQEFHVWMLNVKYRGAWIQLSCSAFAQALESGIPLLKAAVS